MLHVYLVYRPGVLNPGDWLAAVVTALSDTHARRMVREWSPVQPDVELATVALPGIPPRDHCGPHDPQFSA